VPNATAEAAEPLSVLVLIDWQNTYKCAREAFGLDASYVEGQVDPMKLGVGLAGATDSTGQKRELQQIRVYRGKPDNARDPRGYGAWRRQAAIWGNRGGDKFKLCSRDLKYNEHGDGREKGIDVWLAIDLVRAACHKTADRVVVVSTDTDLVPALMLAVEERGPEFVEVAGWVGASNAAALLLVPGYRIAHRELHRTAYDKLADPTDYSVKPQRVRTEWDDQIKAEGRRPRRSTQGLR
jgi:uncharacterized LabA/DUF88 family protein